MSFYEFKNVSTPLNNINGGNVNIDNSHTAGIPFSSNVNPNTVNPNAMPLPGNNVMSAAAKFPCMKGGRKINKKKINKISRKYKMKGSRRKITKHVRRLKSRVKSRFLRHRRTSRRGGCWGKKKGGTTRSLRQRGGVGPMPNYPPGYTQYQNNQPFDKVFSTGGPLSPSLSALATPTPIDKVYNDAVDNLNHNALNSYGKGDAGMGFPSRGWF